jgi:predicted SprT family Zn-dependent metalloprotease
MISKELQARVLAKIAECNAILGLSIKPKIEYRTNMKSTAGFATYSTQLIELNELLFLSNVEDFISRTVVHEYAHLATDKLYPNAKQHHGPQFRSIMSRLGGPITTCHSYSCSSRTYRYTCNCGEIFMLTKLLHNKVSNGQIRKHLACSSRISYWPTGENE